MTASVRLKTASELVHKAEAAYSDGNDATCARLLWEATMSGFQEVATRMGYSCSDQEEAREFAKVLDRGSEHLGHYDGILNFGITMLEHSQGADWTEDPEFAWQFDEFPLAIGVVGEHLALLQAKMPAA